MQVSCTEADSGAEAGVGWGGTPYALPPCAGFCLVAGEESDRDLKLGKSGCCC